MEITFTRAVNGHAAGATVYMPEGTARMLIAAGVARATDNPPPPEEGADDADGADDDDTPPS